MSASLTGTGITFGDGTSQTNYYYGRNFYVNDYSGATDTLTVPSGLTKMKVTCIGGGGGGGGYNGTASSGGYGGGGVGGSGAVSIAFITGLTAGQVITFYVGGGGAAGSGSGGTNGGNGGTTYFGSYCSASGGVGGSYLYRTGSTNATGAAGAGGAASSGIGDIKMEGNMGILDPTSTFATYYATMNWGYASMPIQMIGGLCPINYAGRPGLDYSVGGYESASGYGHGGSGRWTGGATNTNGGVGAPGMILIEY